MASQGRHPEALSECGEGREEVLAEPQCECRGVTSGGNKEGNAWVIQDKDGSAEAPKHSPLLHNPGAQLEAAVAPATDSSAPAVHQRDAGQPEPVATAAPASTSLASVGGVQPPRLSLGIPVPDSTPQEVFLSNSLPGFLEAAAAQVGEGVRTLLADLEPTWKSLLLPRGKGPCTSLELGGPYHLSRHTIDRTQEEEGSVGLRRGRREGMGGGGDEAVAEGSEKTSETEGVCTCRHSEMLQAKGGAILQRSHSKEGEGAPHGHTHTRQWLPQNPTPPPGGSNASGVPGADQHQRQSSLPAGHPGMPPQRSLPEAAVALLRAWMFSHFLHP